ncbi:AAA family ATPase [Saccharospirillum salsuginis]|uniref:Uncharacterized protein n=1 Tax=Saccharospirillum salsuginis TaxID=418750 RepID=A0A918KGJ6_9GAMM|nr:ATP-binding protein [Saccharospirillum salsuginis]GGX62729.1 hypothetical protein GCM10007392_33290 [Saccharospirillum salsuginis]
MLQTGTLKLLIGPVGAGKTTYAEQQALVSRLVFLDLDTWMVRLFGDDPRPGDGVLAWYMERCERCRELIWDLALNTLNAGSDVMLELGLINRAEREAFYARVHNEDIPLEVLLLDAPRDVRRERVSRRNQNLDRYTQIVPPEFFEKASDAWEPVSDEERQVWNIVDISR